MSSVRLSISIALAVCAVSICSVAIGADDPPPPSADTSTNPPPRPLPAIPLNSGISPQEFGFDINKISIEHLQNGTRLYRMNGQGMQSVVAHVGPDGKLTYECTDKIEKAMQATPATSVQENVHVQ